MDVQDTKTRILAAYKLLTEETTTQEKFESVRTLIKGIHPRVDAHLEKTSQALVHLERKKIWLLRKSLYSHKTIV